MVEITEMNAEPVVERSNKLENDRSYKYDSGVSSIVDSTGGDGTRSQSSGYNSTDSRSTNGTWIKLENEVIDPISFNPPCLQSSDLMPKSKILDISSIENLGLVPKSTKGKLRHFLGQSKRFRTDS